MIILHIACTNGDMCNGVQVVVPQHLTAQGKISEVAFVNITNIELECKCKQFKYDKSFSVVSLNPPFNKPDIVVFHECYRIQYIKIAKELKEIGVPYVIIPHGELSNNAQKKKWLKKKVANLLIFNWFINGACGIQLLSETELKNTKFGRNKFIGTNGITIPKRKKEKFSQGGLKFIYIGRLDVYHKGLDLMIQGIARCAEYLRNNRCTFDIYGPDILGRLEQVKKIVKDNQVEDIIKLHNPVFGEEKERLLLEADIFIQTSRFEGMPMGILEALSYGIPCFITEGTTVRSLIEENGAGWGAMTSVESISDTLYNLQATNEGLEIMSRNARHIAEQYFDWSSVANTTIERYESLIK